MSDNNTSLTKLPEFKKETEKLGELTENFIKGFYPSYDTYNRGNDIINSIEKENSLALLDSFTFYRICECKIYEVEDRFAYFSQKLQKVFTSAYSIKQNICYGIVSDDGNVSLVIGFGGDSNNDNKDNKVVKSIIEGLLSGIKFEKYDKKFNDKKDNEKNDKNNDKNKKYVGCICGVPTIKINGEYQNKDLSPLIRSLNGQNYTIMVLCKPLGEENILDKINQAIEIQDKCFAISKRTLSLQEGSSEGKTHAEGSGEYEGSGSNEGVNIGGGGFGAAMGAIIGALGGPPGIAIGAGIGGGIGSSLGYNISYNKSKGTNKSISDAISKTINRGESISGDIQNGFAIELMKMAEKMVERLKIGRNIGMWETLVGYSSDNKFAMDIIQGSLYREIASEVPEILPPVVFSGEIDNQRLIIPKGFFNDKNNRNNQSPLCSLLTSEEICGVCSIPIDNTFGFEINESKGYAINFIKREEDKILGQVCEYDRVLDNVPFGISEYDLNKHTFVCGITGSGKTNTVKKILTNADKPFLVIEPIKKEYRNMENVEVYTLGRPEINCIKINPFYVPIGISPQQHIDSLKDLFSASFSFYGPMPYIVEKCLYKIYENKGWNLTFGLHSYYLKYMKDNKKYAEELFDESKLKKFYETTSHKYLFPNMQDLKDEVERYIKEMPYEGEVKGNIEGAIKARIESLCVGAKGYMFNTNDYLDFDKVFNTNSVFELEGLADDSDKAFALGLLIIYINEYRQTDKELDDTKGLKHLLVIEEAHRLLRNVSTENNADIGNPKGKAVEHFTNMLAEMRSYGQGVIVAEQIPCKLAPDVIKNSSNKIIHRIIAKDDQEIIANTIGVYSKDAIYIGNSKVGYALCHKEGMVQPVIVKVDEIKQEVKSVRELYTKDIEEKIFDINCSIIKNNFNSEISNLAVKTLISLLYKPDEEGISEGLKNVCEEIEIKIDLNKNKVSLIQGVEKEDCIKRCIYEAIINLLISGVFMNHKLPSDKFINLIDNIINNPNNEELENLLENLKKEFREFYNREPENKAVEIVGEDLWKKCLDNNKSIDYELLKLNNNKTIDIEEIKKYLAKKKRLSN